MSDNPLLPVPYEGPSLKRARHPAVRRPELAYCEPCQPLPTHVMGQLVELDEQRQKLLAEDPVLQVLLAEIGLG